MNEVDDFLDRVDQTLWAVRRTPFDGKQPVFVKLQFGEVYHVTLPHWMSFAAADEIVRTTTTYYSKVYRTELVSQMQMQNEKVDADKPWSSGYRPRWAR